MDALDEYRRRYEAHLNLIARKLRDHVAEQLQSQAHVDAITGRAKDPSSFAAKAALVNEDGSRKYSNPLTDIQDQLGVRVVVLYSQDVSMIVGEIKRYFRGIEDRPRVPESQWEFGYFGHHMISPVPRD